MFQYNLTYSSNITYEYYFIKQKYKKIYLPTINVYRNAFRRSADNFVQKYANKIILSNLWTTQFQCCYQMKIYLNFWLYSISYNTRNGSFKTCLFHAHFPLSHSLTIHQLRLEIFRIFQSACINYTIENMAVSG